MDQKIGVETQKNGKTNWYRLKYLEDPQHLCY